MRNRILTPEQRGRRDNLVARANALMPNGEFKDDEARAEFDRLMAEAEGLDGRSFTPRGGDTDEIAIRNAVALAGLESSVADGLIRSGADLAHARSAIFERLTQAQAGTSTIGAFGVGDDGVRQQRNPIVEALVARALRREPAYEAAKPYRHATLIDLARASLERAGERVGFMSRSEIVRRALTHTTSDFPNLLTATGERVLLQAYQQYQGGVRRICRQSTIRDFRAKSLLRLSAAPALTLVGEGGEFKSGSMAESKVGYSLSTYGNMFGLTRQAIINDDLDAFGTMATKYGQAAGQFIATQLAAILTTNAAMDYDGVALFHATHGNLGTPAVISIASLGEALKLMRLQKDIDGTTVLDITPKFLVVPAALEVVARQFVTQINAQKSSDVNPFSAELEVVVDPRLDANSATTWYLAADPGSIAGIEYAFLEGEGGPVFESRIGFEVDGIEIKVRLDFGAEAVEHRGLFKNAGA